MGRARVCVLGGITSVSRDRRRRRHPAAASPRRAPVTSQCRAACARLLESTGAEYDMIRPVRAAVVPLTLPPPSTRHSRRHVSFGDRGRVGCSCYGIKRGEYPPVRKYTYSYTQRHTHLQNTHATPIVHHKSLSMYVANEKTMRARVSRSRRGRRGGSRCLRREARRSSRLPSPARSQRS